MAKKKTTKNQKHSELLGDWVPRHMCAAHIVDHPLSLEERAIAAIEENPANAPVISVLPEKVQKVITPQHIAMLTSKWWGPSKTEFSIFFFGGTDAQKDRIVKFMNIWNEDSALHFVRTNDQNAADFRCSFQTGANGGYYSNVGVDCKSIPKNQNTMNLEGMDSDAVSDQEMMRVVPHEGFHGVGMIHEHQRKAIQDLLDRAKTIREMKIETGWTSTMIIQQVFNSYPESSLMATLADVNSIGCYWFSGKCTKSGKPIPGGLTLSPLDRQFAAAKWPKVVLPPPAGGSFKNYELRIDGAAKASGALDFKAYELLVDSVSVVKKTATTA